MHLKSISSYILSRDDIIVMLPVELYHIVEHELINFFFFYLNKKTNFKHIIVYLIIYTSSIRNCVDIIHKKQNKFNVNVG